MNAKGRDGRERLFYDIYDDDCNSDMDFSNMEEEEVRELTIGDCAAKKLAEAIRNIEEVYLDVSDSGESVDLDELFDLDNYEWNRKVKRTLKKRKTELNIHAKSKSSNGNQNQGPSKPENKPLQPDENDSSNVIFLKELKVCLDRIPSPVPKSSSKKLLTSKTWPSISKQEPFDTKFVSQSTFTNKITSLTRPCRYDIKFRSLPSNISQSTPSAAKIISADLDDESFSDIAKRQKKTPLLRFNEETCNS